LATFNNNFKVKNGLDAISNISTLAGLVVGTSTLPANNQAHILSTTATNVGLTLRAASGQSANMLEIRNSSNSLISYAISNGDWVMPNLFNSYAGVGPGYSDYQGGATSLYVRPTATTRSGAVIKGLLSQTADLLQMQDSSSVILAKIDSVGAFTTNSANGYSIAGAAAFKSLNSGQTMFLTAGGSVAANPHIVIRQSTGATGSLTEWQNSAGTVLGGRSAVGQLFTGSTAPLNSSTGGATTATSGTGTVATITTTSAHSLSTGDRVTVAGVTPTGYNGTFIVASTPTTTTFTYANTTTGSQTVAGTVRVDAQASVTSRSAATVGLLVRGATSQAVDLIQTQTSGGTVNFGVDSVGSVFTAAIMGLDRQNAVVLGNSRNVGLNTGSGSYAGGAGVTFIGNASTAPTSNPTGGGILFVETGALKYRGTSGSAATIVNADGTTAGGGTFTGGTLTSGLVLATGTTTLQPLKFVAGTPGSNLLTTPVTGVKEYDGTVFYSTANTNPGRALETQSYYYVSNSDFYIDFSGSGASQSMFGGPTTGLTVAAGTTYEFELDAAVQHQYQVNAGITGTFAMQNTGGATVAVTSFVDYGSNTTGFTTATTMSSVRTTGNVTFMAAISSGSRYGIIRVRGILRVTGSGTTKVYPGLAASATNDNTWLVASGAVFKMTPIGNGTVTTVGAWA
jgi:hypothetical protein